MYSESGLCRCHFVHHNSKGFSRDVARALAAIYRRLIASASKIKASSKMSVQPNISLLFALLFSVDNNLQFTFQ
jgi:hypothetical protein